MIRVVVMIIKAAFFINSVSIEGEESVKQEEISWEQMNHLHVVAIP